MIVKIKKGNFRCSNWLRQIGLYINTTRIQRVVRFDESCRYDHPGTYDDKDVNKIYRIRYLFTKNEESAGHGWNFDNEAGKPRFYAYTHIDGTGSQDNYPLCHAEIHVDYLLSLIIDKKFYHFRVQELSTGRLVGQISVKKYHDKKIGYALVGRFGGNLPAPHDITYKQTKP